MKPKGRIFKPRTQFPSLGALLSRLGAESSTVLLSTIMIIPALTVSCKPDTVYPIKFENEEPGTEESNQNVTVSTIDYFTKSCLDEFKIETLDILVYNMEGTKSLESHNTLAGEDLARQGHLTVESTSESQRTVVVLANCPKALNEQAISRFESLDLMEISFEDDSPERPFMSGMATFTPGGQEKTAQVELTPLFARIILTAVTNGLPGYQLLDSPSVRLCGLNPSAGILRQTEFRPTESIRQGNAVVLPCDVGFYTQRPEISLFCYPNDTPETTLGATHTSLEFNCAIQGVSCNFKIPLPPVGRNSITRLELTVNGIGDYNITII